MFNSNMYLHLARARDRMAYEEAQNDARRRAQPLNHSPAHKYLAFIPDNQMDKAKQLKMDNFNGLCHTWLAAFSVWHYTEGKIKEPITDKLFSDMIKAYIATTNNQYFKNLINTHLQNKEAVKSTENSSNSSSSSSVPSSSHENHGTPESILHKIYTDQGLQLWPISIPQNSQQVNTKFAAEINELLNHVYTRYNNHMSSSTSTTIEEWEPFYFALHINTDFPVDNKEFKAHAFGGIYFKDQTSHNKVIFFEPNSGYYLLEQDFGEFIAAIRTHHYEKFTKFGMYLYVPKSLYTFGGGN